MSDEGNVIDFNEARKRVAEACSLDTVRAFDKTGKACLHKRVLVGDDFGDVECAGCGVKLDAHTVLLQYAKQERQFWFANKAARDDLAALRKGVAALKAEERRIKSRVRRARQTVSAAEGQIFARGMVEKLEGGEP